MPAEPLAPDRFPARRRLPPSGGAGAVKAGARALCAPPVGLGLDRRSPPSRYTFIPPGRAGVCAARAPPGGRTGALAPPAASGSRPRLEREDGDGAGWAGGSNPRWAPRAGSARRRRSLEPEHGDPPHAQRSSAQPPLRGLGVTGSSSTGGAQRSRCLPPGPLGGGWWGQRRNGRSSAVAPTTGGRNVAWQPSGQRGHASATGFQRCRDRSAGGCADWPYRFDQSGASHCAPAEGATLVGWHASTRRVARQRDAVSALP